MNTELLRHIEILGTVPEIKESIEELKIGTYIIDQRFTSDNSGIYAQITLIDEGDNFYYTNADYNEEGEILDDMEKLNFEIIGQVEERHLRMFLEGRVKRNMGWFSIKEDGYICFDEDTEYQLIILLDDSKPYMEQSSEFFKKLNDWIEKEFDIKG